MTNRKEIESLVFLLDDPDPFVKQSVENRLLELGENAVPLLDEYQTTINDKKQKAKVKSVIQNLTFKSLEEDFNEIIADGLRTRKSLEQAVFALARIGNPTLRVEQYQRKLDQFAQIVEPQVKYKPDERKQMRQLLKFVFETLNFKGDTQEYHAPENGLIDRVIDRRKGLPITLSLIVIFLARRLDMPFFGINMPIHFMLNYVGDKEELLIDPYDNGAVVTYDECYFFLKKNNVTPRPEHFQIASNIDILMRCIRNLIHSYEQIKQPEQIEKLKVLLTHAEYFE